MDMISVACPDCSILLVEINPNLCPSDILEGVATATKLNASAISISLGGPEATDPNGLTMNAGAPARDAGAAELPGRADTWTNDLRLPGPYSSPGPPPVRRRWGLRLRQRERSVSRRHIGGASPSYPASSPYVIAVGGTALYSTGSTYGEGVWDDGHFGLFEQSNPTGTGLYQDVTTSGCSTEFAMPPWQASVARREHVQGTRATADVSAAATFFSGTTEIGITIVLNGTSTPGVEGTSAASPLVAAMYTRLGLTTEASNDLSRGRARTRRRSTTSGRRRIRCRRGLRFTDAPSAQASSCGILCTAGTGWDGPSRLSARPTAPSWRRFP